MVTNGVIGGPNSGEAGTVTPVEADNATALPAMVSEWLNPLSGAPSFVPWPTEETIRRGALASIQVLLDQGVDPATFDPERNAELEAERKRLDEAEMLKAEQEAEKARLQQEARARGEARRRESMGGGVTTSGLSKAEDKPTVFTGLDLLDDDMDEDED